MSVSSRRSRATSRNAPARGSSRAGSTSGRTCRAPPPARSSASSCARRRAEQFRRVGKGALALSAPCPRGTLIAHDAWARVAPLRFAHPTADSCNAVALPECFHLFVGHELTTVGLCQPLAYRRALRIGHDVHARPPRFDLAGNLDELLLILLGPGAHAFQHCVDLFLCHARRYTTSMQKSV